MSHQRRRPFFVLSKNTRWQRGSAQRRTRDSSPRMSASAADSTTGITRPANASPTGTNERMNVPSGRRSTRRVPALRPSTRLISASPSSALRRGRSALGEAAQRRAHASRVDERRGGAAGCCCARRRIICARSASSATPSRATHHLSKSATRRRRRPCSQLTKSSQSRSPTNTKGERTVRARSGVGGVSSGDGDVAVVSIARQAYRDRASAR